jgi:hypothetical protein
MAALSGAASDFAASFQVLWSTTRSLGKEGNSFKDKLVPLGQRSLPTQIRENQWESSQHSP